MSPDYLGQLRSICHGHDDWRALCTLLTEIGEKEPRLVKVAVEYAAGHLDTWPEGIRDATAQHVTMPPPPHWSLARYLDLSQGQCTPAVLETLFVHPELDHWTTLDLTQNHVSADALSTLLQCRAWRALRQVYVRSNPLGAGAHFQQTSRLAQLTHLDLASTRLTDVGLLGLAENSYLGGLKALDLSDNRLTDVGVEALLRSGVLSGVSQLALKFNPLGYGTAKALTASLVLAQLRVLLLRHCAFDNRALAHLAQSPHLGGLRHLDLAQNPIDAAGLTSLAASPYIGNLKRLHLDQCPVGDKGRHMIAQGAFAGVRVTV